MNSPPVRLPRGTRRLRRTATRFTTPLLPDDYLLLLNPLWSARELRGRIVEVVPETDDVVTLVIKPGWGWAFDHRPGQYVGIAVQVDGRFHWRSYSLTSPPTRERGRISVTVKAMPEGFLSRHLVGGVDDAGPARGAARGLRAAGPAAGLGPVPDRRQRHHPDHGHAAHGSPRTCPVARRRAAR